MEVAAKYTRSAQEVEIIREGDAEDGNAGNYSGEEGVRSALLQKEGAINGNDHSHKMGHGHSHSHGHSAKNKKNLIRCLIMISLTFLFFIIELTFGFINRSIALLADSYHMLSDVFALTVALVCLWIANRPSKSSTFGWVRAEVFGALVNGVWLTTMCFTIALESINRIIYSNHLVYPVQVLIVGIIGLIINLVGIYVFHSAGVGHGHSHEGDAQEKKEEESEEEGEPLTRNGRAYSQLSQQICHNHLAMKMVDLDAENTMSVVNDNTDTNKSQKEKGGNLNMKGAYLHILTDAFGSIIVIVSAIITLAGQNFLGSAVNYIDPILSLCLVSLISWTSVRLVRETSEVILRLCPSFIDYEDLITQLLKIRGISRVEKIHCWTLVASRHLATAEIEFCTAYAYDAAVPQIRKVFHKNGIHSLTIQPKFTCEEMIVRENVNAENEAEQ